MTAALNRGVALRRRVRAAREGADDGFTVIELMVSMIIFTIVMIVIMAAVSSMTATAVRTQAVSDNTTQFRTVFQRLDKEVRYASDINVPARVNGNWYVEYLIPANTASGDAECVQWRVRGTTAELQRRSWDPEAPSSVSGWITVATQLRNDLTDSSDQPFTMLRAGQARADAPNYVNQRLAVYLDAGIGESRDASGGQLDVTLVARNSSTSSVTNGTPAETVCLGGGVDRP
ncbi:type II secretion system protein J [Demequina sp. NBRC 110056]|uniref:PulJ/GspJ family protein n=1 Tax=Demequina sp. NBRC 110056 TaxID=1570345 RepID=UPI000A03676B|nr:prepilin-type N-terminal cleavage/methylation domain-containing protein [Demequina sp. NBRC 110056]